MLNLCNTGVNPHYTPPEPEQNSSMSLDSDNFGDTQNSELPQEALPKEYDHDMTVSAEGSELPVEEDNELVTSQFPQWQDDEQPFIFEEHLDSGNLRTPKSKRARARAKKTGGVHSVRNWRIPKSKAATTHGTRKKRMRKSARQQAIK